MKACGLFRAKFALEGANWGITQLSANTPCNAAGLGTHVAFLFKGASCSFVFAVLHEQHESHFC